MINHARTLIRNQTGFGVLPGLYGSEFVEPAYRPYQMPQEMTAIWYAMLGRNPDDLYVNQNLRIIMAAAHSCPDVEDYFLGLDPRITYSHDSKPIMPATEVNIVEQTASGTELKLIGDAVTDKVNGRSSYDYQIHFGTVDITVYDLVTGRNDVYPKTDVGKVLSCGLQPMFLGDTQGFWTFSVLTTLDRDISGILADITVNPANVDKLMREGAPRWREIYKYGHGPAHRLAAVLAAFVEKAETIRNG